MTADGEVERLVADAAGGSADARGRLLVYYRDRLKRAVAARMDPRLTARVDPSDVVQDVLADAAGGLDGYLAARPVDFYVWVRGLAERRVIDLHRRHLHAAKRSVRREAGPGGPPDGSADPGADRFAGSQTSPSQAVVRAEQADALRAGLELVSDDDRELLVLRYIDHLSLVEVAEVLGISVAAAKSRHLRALDRLTAVVKRLLGEAT